MNQMEEIKDYWTLRAEGYSCSVVESIESGGAEVHLKLIGRYADIGKRLDVLDIGTGPGFFAIIMAKKGHEVTAIDYTQAMLEMAKSNCGRYGVDCSFLRMDAQQLDFPDNSFDLILSRNLIWDLEDPRRAYKEWLRVLRPDGHMIVFDGNHYLYLNDKEYEMMESERPISSQHRNFMGVDTNIMKEIAKNLPLSKERRPQWDFNTLIELGAGSVQVDIERMSGASEISSGRSALPRSFIICARK